MDERELPVLQLRPAGQAPRVLVVAGPVERPVSLAASKRQRFIQNLKSNYQRLKEALDFVEYFAVICELSEARVQAIRQAKEEALSELSAAFDQKLKSYDQRIRGGRP